MSMEGHMKRSTNLSYTRKARSYLTDTALFLRDLGMTDDGIKAVISEMQTQPPNISSSRPPTVAAAEQSEQSSAAAEHHRWGGREESTRMLNLCNSCAIVEA